MFMEQEITAATRQPAEGWQASWIWGKGEASPRNEWRCFRRTFAVPNADTAGAVIKITADSRYVLYVNGIRIGRGPVRSWPFELAYDEYEIGHLLKPGAENTVSVLVTHYGIPTFQYLRGRGGLLAQVEIGGKTLIGTDGSWKTAVHAGFETNSSRISCQLGFTEIMDARVWEDVWVGQAHDDSSWESASVIGPAGMEPWVRLVERDIPHLTEEPVYPARVESLRSVKPASWGAVIDLRNLFVPDSVNHANNVTYSGYLATMLRLSQRAEVTLGSVDSGRIFGPCSIDGNWYGADSFGGEPPEKFMTVTLEAGDHFILLDVSGTTHGHGYHFGFDCDAPFEVVAPTRFGGQGESSPPFVAIGPFDAVELIDHQPDRPFHPEHADYERAKQLSSAEGLAELADWVKPVPAELVNLADVFGACVWLKEAHLQPVPQSLQNAVLASADAAVIPVYAGMDTELVIDFGRELSGYISFDVDAAEGTVIDLYGFEYMRDGWRQHTYQLDNTLRYVCREGRQTYVSHVRRGLRYLMVTVRGAARPARLFGVHMLQSNYPVADVGRFHCSDPLLNDIWTISRNTTRMCMEDTFVDCPAFEQAFWVGDARNEALVNYYVFGAREIVERCLRLVPGSSFQTPLYGDQVPSGWSSVIPNWTFFWVTACLEYTRFTGDTAFAADMWPHVRFTLDHYLQKIDERGLLSIKGWNLLDWAAFEQPRDGVVTPQNMFLVKALRDAVELAEAAGDRDGGKRFAAEADRLRTAIDTLLWDESRQAYLDCIHKDGRPSATISMQTQVVALLCGIPQGDRAALLERYAVEPPSAFVQIGSPFMSFFYYEALAKIGRLDVLVADIRKEYGVMIEHEASTCWEIYPSSNFNEHAKLLTRSHCHAWSAGPAYFLGAYVLGVQGLTPGWTKVRVAPQPVGFAWARGAVPLPGGGRVDVSWRVDEAARRMQLRIEAPRGIELDVQAPQGYALALERVDAG